MWMSYVVRFGCNSLGGNVWYIKTPILNFSTIEWYYDNRILKQFACKQDVLDVLVNFDNAHDINKRGKMQKIGH